MQRSVLRGLAGTNETSASYRRSPRESSSSDASETSAADPDDDPAARDIAGASGPGHSTSEALHSNLDDSLHTKTGASPHSKMDSPPRASLRRRPSPWISTRLTVCITAIALALALAIVQSFRTRQIDPKGCRMCYMWPAFARLDGFDTEHTRFASKYSLYLYREREVNEDTTVRGVPVLFITGNAGSYRQVRPLAAAAAQAVQEQQRKDPSQPLPELDFFTADFNEDITAFHGQTLLDQADYLNEALAYILSLYHDPQNPRRIPEEPDPTSVIVIGHSMGGVVARTMLTRPNYQSNAINTIITMSTPHARAPVAFDADIIQIYREVNEYWRRAFAQRWAAENPLWHVTLVSIAGGGLDTTVPSDYASISSLVPPTHGFTVFTSSMPDVWTGSDHLAILWCDQVRKAIVEALIEAVDTRRPGQTKARADRMRIFKRRFLTGLEDIAERTLNEAEPATLLTLEDPANKILAAGERLLLRTRGAAGRLQTYLMPMPPGDPRQGVFNLLADHRLAASEADNGVDVLFCSVFPLRSGQSSALFSMDLDLSAPSAGSTRLACKRANADVLKLPASTTSSKNSFDEAEPWAFLQYQLRDTSTFQFVAVVDRSESSRPGWLVAEFARQDSSEIQPNATLWQILRRGLRIRLPADRPLVTEVLLSSVHSSLLAYKLQLSSQACDDGSALFAPLLRQHVSEPYESKFFVNAKAVDVNIHAVAPFMPPALIGEASARGLALQIWSDPTCNSSLELVLRFDPIGSLGKLVMRYRTVVPAIPLFIIALVLRKQFMEHDRHGLFPTFLQSLDRTLRSSFPALLLASTAFALSIATATSHPGGSSPTTGSTRVNATDASQFARNDLLLGSQDPFFWFLTPILGLMGVGCTVLVHYVLLAVTSIFALVLRAWSCYGNPTDLRRRPSAIFVNSSPRRRYTIAVVLLLMVSTVIPYQFAFLVACIVQLVTVTRALSVARETRSSSHVNFYNYSHSILVLMLSVLPINIPILIVWIHNLAVHWLTPFSSHHNILSIMPFVVLVETLTAGTMIPRLHTGFRHVTNVLFFFLAVYAAVYGITYAYRLHHIANLICAWLVAMHWSGSSRLARPASAPGLPRFPDSPGGQTKKRP